MAEVRYTELTKSTVTLQFMDDINRLIARLSPGAPPCTAQWLGKMFDSGTRMFVAIAGENIVGTVLLVPMVILVGQKDWVEDVVVDEAYARRGIASKLMDMAEQASRERGATSVNLTSKPHRGAARDMYVNRGYHLRDTGVFRLTF